MGLPYGCSAIAGRVLSSVVGATLDGLSPSNSCGSGLAEASAGVTGCGSGIIGPVADAAGVVAGAVTGAAAGAVGCSESRVLNALGTLGTLRGIDAAAGVGVGVAVGCGTGTSGRPPFCVARSANGGVTMVP